MTGNISEKAQDLNELWDLGLIYVCYVCLLCKSMDLYATLCNVKKCKKKHSFNTQSRLDSAQIPSNSYLCSLFLRDPKDIKEFTISIHLVSGCWNVYPWHPAPARPLFQNGATPENTKTEMAQANHASIRVVIYWSQRPTGISNMGGDSWGHNITPVSYSCIKYMPI